MGKMGKRYLVFDGRTMPVLKKKEQQTTTTKEEGTGQASKRGVSRRGVSSGQERHGWHGGGHDEVWAIATATFFKDSQCVSTNGAGIRVNVPRPECHRVPLLDGKGYRTTLFALSAGGGIFLPGH